MRVRLLKNGHPQALVQGYRPQHQLMPVFHYSEPDGRARSTILEKAEAFIVGGRSHEARRFYREHGQWLAYGDVVEVDGKFYAWHRKWVDIRPPRITTRSRHR